VKKIKLLLALIPGLLFVKQVYAGGATLGKDDELAYMAIIGFLFLILVLLYANDFIQKIFRNPDYRERLKSPFISFVNAIREKWEQIRSFKNTITIYFTKNHVRTPS